MNKKEKLEAVAGWLRDFDKLKRRNCTEVAWIMLRLSCKQGEAQKLVNEVRFAMANPGADFVNPEAKTPTPLAKPAYHEAPNPLNHVIAWCKANRTDIGEPDVRALWRQHDGIALLASIAFAAGRAFQVAHPENKSAIGCDPYIKP